MLKDLLGLSSLDRASLVEDPNKRGPLLLGLADLNKDMEYGCLQEAQKLALEAKNYTALTHINCDLSLYYLKQLDIKKAKKCIKKALEFAKHATHLCPEVRALRVKSEILLISGRGKDALECLDESMSLLLITQEICFFCLANCFTQMASVHRALNECNLVYDRLGKALYIGLKLPSRQIQKDALCNLAYSFEANAEHSQQIKDQKIAVAAFVWYAQLSKELDPTDEKADLTILFQDMIRQYGRDKINSLYLSVKNDAKKIVLDALSPFKLDKFISALEVKQSPHGDHW